MMRLEKYSIGIGDRFAHQGRAQLDALIKARQAGVEIVPVWNKSHREHSIIGTQPASVRQEADRAVKARTWTGSYYVDADHINLKNVDAFLEASDFFTLDVADFIGLEPQAAELQAFLEKARPYTGRVRIEGIEEDLEVSLAEVERIGRKFLLAVKEAGKTYRHIELSKGKGSFITEVSVDESNEPQTPVELLFILAAIAWEGIPAQTIAPKFTGRFNKGVDYAGDVGQFTKEFNQDIAVIRFAVAEFGLPDNLKLSVHSGSDKFSIYGPIRQALGRFDAGVHLKTAGTTWLEELIGLAMAGGEGLRIAQEVYAGAVEHCEELCAPYATVIDIDRSKLPSPEEVAAWDGPTYAGALRHDPANPRYNLHFRQMLHLSYKVAAKMGERFVQALERYEGTIAGHVTENLYDRHIKPVFVGS